MFVTTDSLSFSSYVPLFVGTLIAYIIYFRWKTSYWSKYGIKGPQPFPFIGLATQVLSKPIWQLEMEYFKKYGSLVARYSGTRPDLIISDPDLIKTILVKDFHIFPQGFKQPYLMPAQRKFLTMLYGEEWKRVRSLISPTFTTGKLRRMFEIIKFCLNDCLDNLDLHTAKNDAIDLKYFWGRYDMDVIARVCFATNLNAYKEGKNSILENFEAAFIVDPIGAFIVAVAPTWLVRLTKSTFAPHLPMNYLNNLTMTVIENRKKDQTQSNCNDFLQLLLESEIDGEDSDAKQRLTTEEIVGSALIFLLAGYETTSTLLTWTCWELTNHPEIQERLYKEISSLDKITYDSIQTLPYLNAVLEESLRKHPPVVEIQRTSHQNYQIPGTQATLPKGSTIFIPIYAIHHNPEYWPNPEVYNPERFMPENKDSIVPYTFLPFGGGPRLCIGLRFAMTNAKLALASVLMKYKFIKNEKTTKKLEFNILGIFRSPKNIKVGIQRRS